MPLPLDESNPIGSRRYQLTVVAASIVDLVGSAGGWMCDKARAGWDVKVVLTDDDDTRPLAILGASPLDVDAELSDVMKMASHGGALAVSAGVLADERIRAGVLGILKRGLTEVTVWGQDWPTEFSRKADPVEHRAEFGRSRVQGPCPRCGDGVEESGRRNRDAVQPRRGRVRPLHSV